MTTTRLNLLRGLLAATAFVTLLGTAEAKNVPGDGATPVVELMPLTMKHEADLKLTAEQIQALEAFRKEAMPVRLGVQKRILQLRGQLRMAILDSQPAAVREDLMRQVAEAEIEHFKGRDRCVERVRVILNAEQFGELKRLYLAGLR